jgi:hypothetical protein
MHVRAESRPKAVIGIAEERRANARIASRLFATLQAAALKTKSPPSGLEAVRRDQCDRRRATANPNSPRASKASEAGSGTLVGSIG